MSNIDSPCIAACSLNKDNICQGCFRSLTEISRWGQANDKQKTLILSKSKTRQKEQLRVIQTIESQNNRSEANKV